MTLSDVSGAIFSPDRQYRQLLWRVWDKSLPTMNIIMLNPSKAGEVESDPTVTRQIERAKRLGCGTLLVTNAFDLVATDPRDMKKHPKPNSEDNDAVIVAAAHNAKIVIAAWGNNAAHHGREAELLRLLHCIHLKALRINDDMSPGHPLYIPYDAPLLDWPVF